MKIYLSSSYQDLREHRRAVDETLRRMGHDVIGMERYVAEESTPLERCLADVRSADVYLVVVAWRYGHRPVDPANPAKLSITELEYEAAVAAGIPVLAFLLDPDAPWPPSAFDALGPGGGESIVAFRARLGARHLAGIFLTADNLASLAAAAIARQGLSRHIVERNLRQAEVTDAMLTFAQGIGQVADPSNVPVIEGMVKEAALQGTRSLLIRLVTANDWWSTRLYLLVTLLQLLTEVRQIVFASADGRFTGMASPDAIRAVLCERVPELAAVDAAVRSAPSTGDLDRELDRVLTLWAQYMGPDRERQVQVGIRWSILARWLGERGITRCIRIDPDLGLTMVQVQQLVDSLIPDVPVERWNRPPSTAGAQSQPDPVPELLVVDRDAFALQLARDWVHTGLPRTVLS